MNPDFQDILSALCDEDVEFLVVGAYALAAHGLPRATGDLDLWIRPAPRNAARALKALERFGAPLGDLTREDLTKPGTVFQIGVTPRRIDILTEIDGVSFDEAWSSRMMLRLGGGEVAVLGREELIRNKRATGRPRDRVDADELEAGS